jgi:hypothetical protein
VKRANLADSGHTIHGQLIAPDAVDRDGTDQLIVGSSNQATPPSVETCAGGPDPGNGSVAREQLKRERPELFEQAAFLWRIVIVE